MFKVGDLIVYAEHGICRIDDITDQTFSGITREYYILHPIKNDQNLTISVPVNIKNSSMQNIMDKDEAEDILKVMETEEVEWIEKLQDRNRQYTKIVNTGDREEIAQVARTLIKKKREIEEEGKKFPENDRTLLETIESILFEEIAIALDTTPNKITQRIENIIFN